MSSAPVPPPQETPARGRRVAPPHQDPGLQPERTTMSWGRTLLSLVIAAALLLRWLPEHGWATLLPLAAAGLLALTIWLRQGRRYGRASRGIVEESVRPAVGEVLWVGSAVVVLAGLGLTAVVLG